MKRPSVNILDDYKIPERKVATVTDNLLVILDYVNSGDYNSARELLATLPKTEQAAIKINVALSTQVML